MTTYPTVRLRLAPAAAIRARVTTTLNSRVEGGTGINVTSATGIYTVGLGFDKLGPIGAVPDKDVTVIPVYDPLTQVYSGITFHDLAADIGSNNGQALTKANDTNVTLTLTGTPATALLQDVTITAGWTGTLAVARGGTGGGSASGTLLDNITGFASTGLLARTASGTYAFRTLTAPAAGITVSNGDGVSGAPTLALANDLAALEGFASVGIAARTGTDTWAQRTVTGTASRLSVTNGNGVSGNPTLDIDAAYVGQTSITTLGTVGTGTWQATAIAAQYGGFGSNISASSGVPLFATGTPTFTSTTGSGNFVRATSASITTPAISGGTATGLTGLGIRSTGAAFDLKLAATSVYTADRTLTLVTGDAARTVTLSGDLTVNGGTALSPGVAGQVGVWSGGALSGSATPTLGASGTLGSVTFGNATSGTVTLQPVTGALGTVTLSLPAATDTLVGKATTDTLTNKTLTSPTLTTPTLGVATATSINKMAITAPATSSTLAVANGKTFTASSTITLAAGADGQTFTFPAATDTVAGLGTIQTFTAAQTFNSSKLVLAGATSGTTTLNSGAIAGSSVLTLPIATDTLVGKATTDTLTNKTFNTGGTGNVLQINGTAVSTVTGTGSVMLAASPTTTGTLTGAAANFSGTVTFGTGTITGLTNKASPDGVNDYIVIYDNAGTAIKKATVGSISAAGSVASFNSLTGAVTSSVVVQKFTSSGTYTPTSGMLHAIIECVGGGGGGGGTDSSAGNYTQGGGGGGGGYSRKFTTAAAVGASQTVTIGAAGTAGSAGSGGNGGAGGNTSVGTLCIGVGASGGGGATSGVTAGAAGAGGVAGTGDVTIAGQAGMIGWANSFFATSGFGGSSGLAFGQGGYSAIAAAGVAGTGFGGGGSGGGSAGATGSKAGGAGSAGVVIITEFVNL